MQVLSDPEKRKIYDQFGEEGLKGGMGGMGGGGMPGGMPGGGAQFRSMEEVLKEVCLNHSVHTQLGIRLVGCISMDWAC